MSTRHLVDADLLSVLDATPSGDYSRENLDIARAQFNEFLKLAPAPPTARVRVNSQRVPGPVGAPEVRLLVYIPAGPGGARPALLHIHGGGYIIGRPEMNHARNLELAEALDMVVVSVDYRLAPEAVFPAAVEDCYAALKWLVGHSRSLAIDPKRIAIGGESAGGGLAAALGLLVRDRAEFKLAFQLLIYPMIDDRTGMSGLAMNACFGEFIWTAASNRFGWSALLGRDPGAADVSCYAAAARAASAADLPPTYIAVGALDLFLEEDMTYAGRLLSAGVPTELHVYPGAYHGFDFSSPGADVSRTFKTAYTEALRHALKCPRA